MPVTWNTRTVPVEIGALSLDDDTLVLAPPARWSDFIHRRNARSVTVEPSIHWRFYLSKEIPRAELHTAFLMSFGEPNDLFDDWKQSFSWWLNLSLDVGRLMGRDSPGPRLELILRASDYRGGTDIRLLWPKGPPAEAAAFTQEVYDRLLYKLAYLVGFRVGSLEVRGMLPDWSLRCPETRGRFGCRRGTFFDVEGPAPDDDVQVDDTG